MGRLSRKSPEATEMVSLDALGTRDALLLSQLAEEYGSNNLSKIHQQFINHPAFKLSHNKLDGTELELTEEHTGHLLQELLERHPGLKIVSVCEHYYNLRLQELMAEIRDTKQAFEQVKG